MVSAQALWGDPDDPGHDQPAHVPGYGPIPAWLARHLVREAPDETPEAAGTGGTGGTGGTAPATGARAATFLRRLWACPDTGALVALESRRRVFDGGLRRFLIARDQTCRTPYCDAPLRQVDHVRPYADGGPTTAGNGQGLCTRCNQTKEAPGWRVELAVDDVGLLGRPRGLTSFSAHPDAPPERVAPTVAAATRSAPASPHRVVITTPTGRTYLSTAPPVLSRPQRGQPAPSSAAGRACREDLLRTARRSRTRRELARAVRDVRCGRPRGRAARRLSPAERRLVGLLTLAA